MAQQTSSGAMALFFTALVCIFTPARARVGSPMRNAPASEDGQRQNGAHVHPGDLPGVLAKAVDMMNSGVVEFLKEEIPNSLPPRDEHHERRPEDFLRVAKSQERALKLLRQLSNDFISLNGVTQKLKNQTQTCAHVHHEAEGDKMKVSEVKDMIEETRHLKNTVNVLLKKTEVCQDTLQGAQQAAMDCNAKINATAQSTSAADEKANADTQQENDVLHKEASELRRRNDELERRVAGLEGNTNAQQQGALAGDVKDLRKQIKGLEEDKQAMIHTMQQFMRTNETESMTKSLQQELATARRQHLQMEMRYQQKIATLEKRLKDATDKNKDISEVTKEIQEDDLNKDQTIDQLKVQINNFQQVQKEAGLDKKQLLSTLQGVLRENTHFQNLLNDAQAKLKQSEQVRKRDCPATGDSKSLHDQAQTKVEQQPSQQQSVEAQTSDRDIDTIATMGEALPINNYLSHVREQDVIDSTQDGSSAVPESSLKPPPAPVNSIPSEEDLPQSLKLSAPHSAPVRSALSRWLGVSGAADAAASRLPHPSAASPVKSDGSDPADSTSLLAEAQRSVDDAGDDDESANESA